MGEYVSYLEGYTTEAVEVPAPEQTDTPDLSVLIDFAHDVNPAEELPTPNWTELISVVRSPAGVTFQRGRSRPLDRNEAGSLSLILYDPDRDLDPANLDSPYWPNVAPMRRIRIAALCQQVTDPFVMGSSETGGPDVQGGGGSTEEVVLFDGLVESFSYDYARGFDPTVTIKATDWLGALARTRFSYDMPTHMQDPGDPLFEVTTQATLVVNRLNLILDQVGFPRSNIRPDYPDQEDYPRSEQIAPLNYVDAEMLAALFDAADVDRGNLYAARDGEIVYVEDIESEAPDDRLIIDASFQQFVDVGFIYDDTLIANDIRLSSTAGVFVFEDLPSQQRFFRRKKEVSLPFAFDPQAPQALGTQLLERYAEPRKTINRLDLSNVIVDWAQVLSTDLWRKVMVRVRLPNGDVVEQLSLVEGIEVSTSSRLDWRVVWWLSDAAYPNLIVNGDFEVDITGWSEQDWPNLNDLDGPWQEATEGADFKRSLQQHSHGTAALQLDNHLDGVAAITDPIVIDSRASYRATAQLAYISLSNLFITTFDNCRVELVWLDENQLELSYVTGPEVSVRTSGSHGGSQNRWTGAFVEGRAPLNARYVRVRVGFVANDPATGLLELADFPSVHQGPFVDDVKLRRIS